MKFAHRIQDLGTEAAFEVLERVQQLERQGRSILHFEMGEPGWGTEPEIVEAGIAALRDGKTRYTSAQGDLRLRQAIAKEVSQSRAISVDAEEIVVVPGAKPILFFAALALLEPGDEVILPDPSFPIFESVVRFAGAKPVPLRLRMENAFRPDLKELANLFSPRTRKVIVNSPQNPTGGVWTREDFEQIAALIRSRENCWLLSDEIYSKQLFDGVKHESPIALPEMKSRTVLVDGFSKSYAMTGWRLGYGVMPAELAQVVTKLVINSFSCVPPFIQEAGLAALQGPQEEVLAHALELAKRRDKLVTGLNSLPGFRCLKPQGSPYVFPDITNTGRKEVELQKLFLEEAGVACIAGTAFGAGGAGHLRFSFTESIEKIDLAIERLRRVL